MIRSNFIVSLLVCCYYLLLVYLEFGFWWSGFGVSRNLGLQEWRSHWRRRPWMHWKQWGRVLLKLTLHLHLFKHCWVEYQQVLLRLFFTSSLLLLRQLSIARQLQIISRFVLSFLLFHYQCSIVFAHWFWPYGFSINANGTMTVRFLLILLEQLKFLYFVFIEWVSTEGKSWLFCVVQCLVYMLSWFSLLKLARMRKNVNSALKVRCISLVEGRSSIDLGLWVVLLRFTS